MQKVSSPLSLGAKIENLSNQLDWNCRESALKIGSSILVHLASDRSLLRDLVENLTNDTELFLLCEKYDFFDKLILYKDPADRFKIRLSIFSPFVSNRPHFHRWSYVAMILKGNYLHSVFCNESALIDALPESLQSIHMYEVTENSPYYIHHSCVHAVKAKSGTVSLLLQGPPQKERFLVVDQKIKRKWWEYGSQQETTDEKQRKQISQDRLLYLIDLLKNEKII